MKHNTIIFLKDFFYSIILVYFVFIILFICMEMSLRVYERIRYGVPLLKSSEEYVDPVLGWEGVEVFGDINTSRYKILLIGDSFTEGCGVKPENMYYKFIGDILDAEMFVYGGGGYGTLQEYLALEKYFDKIKPDLVMIQVASNDFINNSYELESKSFRNNNQGVRPYWRDGRIEYLFPRSYGRQRVILQNHFRVFHKFFRFAENICHFLAVKDLLPTVEDKIGREGINYKDFREAVNATNVLVGKIKEKAKQAPIVIFTSDDNEPCFGIFKDIFQKNGIPFIGSIPQALRDKEKNGEKLRLKDGVHLNENGHKIAGNLLADELKRLGVIGLRLE